MTAAGMFVFKCVVYSMAYLYHLLLACDARSTTAYLDYGAYRKKLYVKLADLLGRVWWASKSMLADLLGRVWFASKSMFLTV